MTPPIAISRNQNCWGSRNEDFLPPQQNPHGNGYHQSLERSLTGLAICAKGVVQARAGAVLGRLETRVHLKRLPASQFQSAATSTLRSVITTMSCSFRGYCHE